jgi:hypothetical protein
MRLTKRTYGALEGVGVEFIDENGGGTGFRLRKPAGAKSKNK